MDGLTIVDGEAVTGDMMPGVTMDGLAIVNGKAVTSEADPFGGGGAARVHDLGIDAVC
uniref:Uncharacterized protein n=1 Tax=Fagus sylvatica TaxID=28930 RepID=A0A2N9ITN9_FAGSY